MHTEKLGNGRICICSCSVSAVLCQPHTQPKATALLSLLVSSSKPPSTPPALGPPWEQAREHAGLGQPCPGASEVEGAALQGEMSGQREQSCCCCWESPSSHTCDTAPSTLCSPLLQRGPNTGGQGMHCPSLSPAPAAGLRRSMWHLPAWASSLPLARQPWKTDALPRTQALLARQEQFVRAAQKSLPGCLCLKYTSFAEAVPEQRGTRKRLWQGEELVERWK